MQPCTDIILSFVPCLMIDRPCLLAQYIFLTWYFPLQLMSSFPEATAQAVWDAPPIITQVTRKLPPPPAHLVIWTSQ